MLQRVQTLYLVIALICMLMLVFFPIAEFITTGGHVYELRFFNLVPVENYNESFQPGTWPFTTLISIIIIILVADIFFFRNRMLQMRLTIFNIVLMFGLTGMIYYYVWQIVDMVNAIQYTFHVTCILPVVSAVLLILAFRGIRADELLIKSLNRIR
ncbi:MAG: DUF4293 domain-containing protein [Bacteroidales bacterium]